MYGISLKSIPRKVQGDYGRMWICIIWFSELSYLLTYLWICVLFQSQNTGSLGSLSFQSRYPANRNSWRFRNSYDAPRGRYTWVALGICGVKTESTLFTGPCSSPTKHERRFYTVGTTCRNSLQTLVTAALQTLVTAAILFVSDRAEKDEGVTEDMTTVFRRERDIKWITRID